MQYHLQIFFNNDMRGYVVSEAEIANLMKEAKRRVKNGQFNDAEYFFKKITKIDPVNAYAWYGRGLCLIRELSYETASYCFTKAVELDASFAKSWYNLGFCQAELGQYSESLANLKMALEIDEKFAIARVMTAWVYLQQGLEPQASEILDSVIQKDEVFVSTLKGKDPSTEPRDFQIAYKLILQ